MKPSSATRYSMDKPKWLVNYEKLKALDLFHMTVNRGLPRGLNERIAGRANRRLP